ncbi:HAMP domain-containing histidine kinase [Streptomyces sp. NBC_00285]|uniref:sensor histidine kinase n=1 Tax=Streptomyces sp. NBC_00285 TaxID=2975700 RepID=UPI002E287576|nr:HAMP domain-containing sensor histidine kinase [Streptomyces sp. NBC_00285]
MSARIPLHKRLLVRLLITSGLIAVCSVAATAWLAVATTTQALREEQGQALADDMEVLAELSGYAATHPDWTGATATVRRLSAKTGRRIALTTPDRRTIADSAPRGTSLPPTAAATVDPLHTDTYSERGAQISGTDPRVVGPYRLTRTERAKIDVIVRKRQLCFAQNGIQTTVVHTPSGRPVLTEPDSTVQPSYVPEACGDGLLNSPTRTEEKALGALHAGARACLTRKGLSGDTPLSLGGYDLRSPSLSPVYGKPSAKQTREAQTCVDEARHAQLDPYVAPVAELFLGTGDTPAVLFDMSPANKAKVVGTAGLVLAVTVIVTALVATRLVRPLRALTAAAQQPPELHTRVPVTTRDETGILAAAFNDLAERRERLETQRRAMVSDIAHELRSPLTNIRGWLEVTRDGLVDPDPALLGSLHEEALVLQRVIDDLQDLADADAGTLRLHREPVRCDELLQQVAAAHRIAADAAGVGLRTDVDGLPWLDADPVRMRQVLGNLVSNAVRHTPAGGTVTLSAHPDGDDVVLEVSDTGSGIAPDDLPHVFDRFWRAEKSRSRRTGGSGLGLPIVRHLVAAHGGTVAADSEPGSGSVFSLRLPGGPTP